jgi:ketosteroid isomerase-like protein
VASDTHEAGSSADSDANKKLVSRYFDAMQRGAMDEATEFWASEAINYASGRKGQQPARGRDAIGMVHRMLRAAFPDRQYQIDYGARSGVRNRQALFR